MRKVILLTVSLLFFFLLSPSFSQDLQLEVEKLRIRVEQLEKDLSQKLEKLSNQERELAIKIAVLEKSLNEDTQTINSLSKHFLELKQFTISLKNFIEKFVEAYNKHIHELHTKKDLQRNSNF